MITGKLQADLLERANACDRDLTRYPRHEPANRRAREMLRAAAAACRTVADVFDLDPTLVDEPWNTGRSRPIDLLLELTRLLPSLLRGSVFSQHARAAERSLEERWAEAESICARIKHLADRIPAVVPRHHTTAGEMQAISGARLAANHTDLATAAETVRTAVDAALRLPDPDPRALDLLELAGQLQRHARKLGAEHRQSTDVIAGVLELDPA